MGISLSLHFISSTLTSLKEILLARVPNKRDVQTPLLLTQRHLTSKDLVWPTKRLLTTEPPRETVYSPTPEQVLPATLPYNPEIKTQYC